MSRKKGRALRAAASAILRPLQSPAVPAAPADLSRVPPANNSARRGVKRGGVCYVRHVYVDGELRGE